MEFPGFFCEGFAPLPLGIQIRATVSEVNAVWNLSPGSNGIYLWYLLPSSFTLTDVFWCILLK